MVVVTFLPFLFLFASAWKLLAERPPGGRAVSILVPLVGFLTTIVSIVFAVIPSEEEQNPVFALSKVGIGTVLLIGSGLFAYRAGKRRAGAWAGGPRA